MAARKPKAQSNEISINRPYGGRIVLRADQPLPEFFAWATSWFKALPQELVLIPTSPEDQARRESALVLEVGTPHAPRGSRIEVRYEAGPGAGAASRGSAVGETYRAAGDFERRSISNFIIARDDEETPRGTQVDRNRLPARAHNEFAER